MKLTAPKFWDQRGVIAYLLTPLSGIYRLIIAIRYSIYKFGLKSSHKFNVPVVIVGNISVGGTGKTPLVIWLAAFLQQQGLKPGIVSRGYGGHSSNYPCVVHEASDPKEIGDEALLISQRTHCPMVVAPNRVAAVQKLLRESDCNIVISDDGLQHYALKRDIEIVVIDAAKGLGNGFCLPAGPLREPKKRLQQVDLVVKNGVDMQLQGDSIYNLNNPNLQKPLTELKGQKVHAVAGIGNNKRFFKQLRSFSLAVVEHPFSDHYPYQEQDLNFNDDDFIVIMTEKDAVKCQHFAKDNFWCLPVKACLNEDLTNRLLAAIKRKT
ncbi:MAG: tetraacyldisaccharide 4'-kinase [Gammaproteobacteria bacterium]|nr:tetraacyldisaccharide 4'-kinase [Gammaproteobacteria bacterium]